MVSKKEPAHINRYMGHGEHILIVDDEAIQGEIACKILSKLGYDVNAVLGGEMAIEYLAKRSVDLVVLDMIMPNGINGLETYKRIQEVRPDQKAIIASGFSETADVKEAQKLGVGKYIKKPYTIEKIGLAVREELGK
jgi:DNA-binding NtrC family response regulator